MKHMRAIQLDQLLAYLRVRFLVVVLILHILMSLFVIYKGLTTNSTVLKLLKVVFSQLMFFDNFVVIEKPSKIYIFLLIFYLIDF
jgi:hypothetical protein